MRGEILAVGWEEQIRGIFLSTSLFYFCTDLLAFSELRYEHKLMLGIRWRTVSSER